MEFETHGFDLSEVAKEARENGREDVANLFEEVLTNYENAKTNVQTCYDTICSKWTSTSERPWAIDSEALKEFLK